MRSFESKNKVMLEETIKFIITKLMYLLERMSEWRRTPCEPSACQILLGWLMNERVGMYAAQSALLLKRYRTELRVFHPLLSALTNSTTPPDR